MVFQVLINCFLMVNLGLPGIETLASSETFPIKNVRAASA